MEVEGWKLVDDELPTGGPVELMNSTGRYNQHYLTHEMCSDDAALRAYLNWHNTKAWRSLIDSPVDAELKRLHEATRYIRDEIIRIHMDWRFWAAYFGLGALVIWVFDLPLF